MYKLDMAVTYSGLNLNVPIRKELEGWGLVHKEDRKQENQTST